MCKCITVRHHFRMMHRHALTSLLVITLVLSFAKSSSSQISSLPDEEAEKIFPGISQPIAESSKEIAASNVPNCLPHLAQSIRYSKIDGGLKGSERRRRGKDQRQTVDESLSQSANTGHFKSYFQSVLLEKPKSENSTKRWLDDKSAFQDISRSEQNAEKELNEQAEKLTDSYVKYSSSRRKRSSKTRNPSSSILGVYTSRDDSTTPRSLQPTENINFPGMSSEAPVVTETVCTRTTTFPCLQWSRSRKV